MIINGKEYPFTEPTHKVVGDKDIALTAQERQELLEQWAAEWDRIEAELAVQEQPENP